MVEEHQVDLLIYKSDIAIFPVKHPNLRFIAVAEYLKKPLYSMFWHLFVAPFCYRLKSYDLVFLPAGNRRLFVRYPSRTVVTFHDLSQFHVSAKYDKLRMAYIKHIIPHYLKKAPHIYAISENTKNDIIRFYHIPPNRIKVNYNGYDRSKLQVRISEIELRTRIGVEKPYLLYISRLEHPGKNHLNLIKAYELLPAAIRETHDLILAGSPWSGSEKIYEYASQSVDKERIHFSGFVPNDILAALYKYARLYVFPSLYEGFGIPLLEAMASGVPVVCANRSSLPEIGGNAVLSFDPEYPADIATKIERVLLDRDLYQSLVDRGLQRASEFSWEKHTHTILNTFTEGN